MQCIVNDTHNQQPVIVTILKASDWHLLKFAYENRDEPDSRFYVPTDRASLMRLRDLIDGALLEEPKVDGLDTKAKRLYMDHAEIANAYGRAHLPRWEQLNGEQKEPWRTQALNADPEDVEDTTAMAARWRWLCINRPTLLITAIFGNGCVNKTIDDVEAIIDRADLTGGLPVRFPAVLFSDPNTKASE